MKLGVSAALVDGRLVRGDVAINDGVVTAVGLAASGNGSTIAAPGFVDVQVNGFAGVDFAIADVDGYRAAGAALLATGVTSFRPTFISAPTEKLVDALRALPAVPIGPRVLGAHLEGPFLSPARPGTHDSAALSLPDVGLVERLLKAGPVRQMTLAPELPGALELLDTLVTHGITVSAGHSDASAREANRAFDRGITTVTHLFNAMRLGTPREPGIALAALGRPEVSVQMIVDGHHVSGDTVLAAWHAAAGRLALVSDAVAAAGMPDGDFTLAGRTVRAVGGVVRGAGGELAGSAVTMIAAVRNLHGLGVPLADALSAASSVPARIARRSDLGRLAPGAPADIVVLDDRLEVRRVLLDGETLVVA